MTYSHELRAGSVHVDNLNHTCERCAVSWHTNDAAYHVWVALDAARRPVFSFKQERSRTLSNQVYRSLYKNSLPGTEYFDTRKLDHTARLNRKMIEKAFDIAIAGDLFNKAIDLRRANDSQEAFERREAAKLRVLRDNASAMYAMLGRIMRTTMAGAGKTMALSAAGELMGRITGDMLTAVKIVNGEID